MTRASILTLRQIHTQFGSQIVHDHLDLDVFSGEILGIVGGSGSGKSVLLRIMAGLDTPQKGRVVYPKTDIQRGMLFQNGALISSLSVVENVAVPLIEMAKTSSRLAYQIARHKLSLVGLGADAADKYPSQLSGGMVKRVGIARALALDPEIVFLDEPTAGLDPISAAGFDELVLDLRAKLNLTVVLVTHDLDTLHRICDRLAVLVDHQVIAGKIEEIAHQNHPWIQSYFQGIRGYRLFGMEHGTQG